MGGGGGSGKTTNVPWTAAQPYLIGNEGKGTAGVFPEASKLYGEGGWTPQMQQFTDNYAASILNRNNDPSLDYAKWGAGQILQGGYDTRFNGVANIAGAPQVNAQSIQAPQTSLTQARQGQGALNPTQSLQQLLSGQPNNPYLDQQAAAITGQLTRNMNENVMPGLRSEALASGMYGGSRQGIAEGLAASRLNQDLAPALTSLYGGAYENAQNRMQATAGTLNDQAFQNAQANAGRQFAANQGNVQNNLNAQQFNANNALNTQQFNANLGLQNNAQRLNTNTQNLNNRLQGLGVLNSVGNMQDVNYGALMDALQGGQNFNWQNLSQYNSMINPGIGGVQTQSASKNRLVGGLGGAASGAMAGAMVGSVVPGIGTAVGALGGAILGGAGGALA